MKFFLKSLIIIFLIIVLFITLLSYFGLETDKFDALIIEKSNLINKNVQIKFNKTKIYLNISDLKLLIKLQEPKVIVKNKEINLSKLNFSLSLKSFYTGDFILDRADIGFKNNDIKDLAKITNIFLPRFINKQLKKVFEKGSLDGNFVIPFNPDGSISQNYKFYGSIKDANLKFPKGYKIDNLTTKISYGRTNNIDFDGLRIRIEDGSILNLELSKSIIDINFKENSKKIKSTLYTNGDLNFSEIKKISSLLGYKINNFKDINLQSDLITNFEFDINNKFVIKNVKYNVKGNINKLEFKTNENNYIKNFLPDVSKNIIIKPAHIIFTSGNREESYKIDGNINFSKEFEKFKITLFRNKKNNKIDFTFSSSLKNSSVKIKKLNYKKDLGLNAQINLHLEFLLDQYLLIKSLIFSEDKSKIVLKNIELNKKFQLIDLENIKIMTYSKNLKNNDFSIKKDNKIIISGKVLDIQSLLKSLFKNDDKKTFSNKFNTDFKINIQKAITGTGDDVSDLSIIGSIDKGSFDKLSLKGNFSDNEIVEMSIYQVDKDKKTVQVISDRARPFIKNFDFIEGFEGGKLFYESNAINKKSNSNLLITNFQVSKVPALAQLLTLASFQGIADTLSGEGIRFESFEMKSYTENNVMNIEDALAMGPAVSILLNGYIDKGNIISLRGTLVPATKLNSIIASIPVVGDILVGSKEGEGIVGVSFKMKGPPKNIKTTVNPIKTLTPRFIVRALENRKKNKKDKSK